MYLLANRLRVRSVRVPESHPILVKAVSVFMPNLVKLRRVLPATIIGIGLLMVAPQASAAEADPVSDVTEQVRSVAREIQTDIDRAVDGALRAGTGVGAADTAKRLNEAAIGSGLGQIIPDNVIAAAEAVAPDDSSDVHGDGIWWDGGAVSAVESTFDASRRGPNYQWRTDVVSQLMAGRPGPVLNRVSGSWFNGPDIPEESFAAQRRGKSLFGPGTPVFIGPKTLCTLGVAGYDAEGRAVGITAGHCGNPGEAVISADSWEVGQAGTVVASSRNYDYSVIEFNDRAELTRSYNGVTVNSVGGTPVNGEILCKQGVATGHTCGTSWISEKRVNFSQVCAMRGDSGAPLLAGDRLVGVVSGGVFPDHNLSCRSPLQGPFFMPTASPTIDAITDNLNAGGAAGAGFVLPPEGGPFAAVRGR
ncbi:S1 family peptidase [Corynebacterium sp. CCM 9204]|uniref:S1 family peptidase n=1 Tax=Corynebacterium sp. CCM 9204 TaxID=3057616 RepID=UPI00352413FD